MSTYFYYQERAKEWWLLTVEGRVVARAKTRPEIIRQSLRQDCPEALALAERWIQNYPQLSSRCWSATIIYARGHVCPNGGYGRYRVLSQKGERIYEVDARPQFRSCTCPDFGNAWTSRFGAPIINGRPLCKHILACLMDEHFAKKRGEQLPSSSLNSFEEAHDVDS